MVRRELTARILSDRCPDRCLPGQVPADCSPKVLLSAARSADARASLLSMGRELRGCFAGKLVETTSKTVQGRFLLRPSRAVNATLKGVIARAQVRTDMKIVAAVALSNHVHFLLRPDSTLQLKEFMEYFMSNSARKIGRLHGWHGALWAKRYKPIIVSDEEAAQIARLKYLLSHGAKEGLVRKPDQWPGLQVVSELCRGADEVYGGEWHDRTAEYRARLNGQRLQRGDFVERGLCFRLTSLPCWDGLVVTQRTRAVRDLVTEITREARAQYKELGVLGVRKVLRQHPRRENPSESRPAPKCHAISAAARLKILSELRGFAEAFSAAVVAVNTGRQAAFPPGCFPPAQRYVPEAIPG